jgi:hypothetical protein
MEIIDCHHLHKFLAINSGGKGNIIVQSAFSEETWALQSQTCMSASALMHSTNLR